jgi:two-component system sensor histidine kinase/response regulator
MAGADCLLVVDSEEANLKALGTTLGKVGFEILPALDGAQALSRLATRRPDLILIDMSVPDMDGLALCRKIQENPVWADIPIIFLSATDDKDLIVRALESGGVDCITRPFDRLELVSRVRTHLMLKTSRDHLKRLAQDKEELLGVISHHLQNHFAAMEMSAHVLMDRLPQDDASQRRVLTEIQIASRRMRGFVKSFLANSAADYQLNIKMQTVSLADAATRVAGEYRDTAKSKSICLKTEIGTGDTMVRADPNALAQVLDNLVSNAVKFSPPGMGVLIAVKPGVTQTECHVQDQGAGFTPEDKAAMFGRYARLSARPTGGEPSTGLGLSIARKLVLAMNGELVCESEQGRGATFILRLPSVSDARGARL